jgi:hypothetical protein
LILYAAGLACDALGGAKTGAGLALCQLLLILPALSWTGAMISLLPEDRPLRAWLLRGWVILQLPLAGLLYASRALRTTSSLAPFHLSEPLDLALLVVVLAPLLAALLLLGRLAASENPRSIFRVLLTGLTLFSLATAFILVPINWLPRPWLILALGVDLLILGFGIAALDAFDQGQALLPDFLRSLVQSGFTALLFGGLVGLAMALNPTLQQPLSGLLFAVLAAAVLAQTYAAPLQGLLDGLLLAAAPRSERAALRGSADAVLKLDRRLDPDRLPMDEFARLTRKALSLYGNLPRLAASPLTRMKVIDDRLAARNEPDHTLARASELKALLTEAIANLKPAGGEDFGETEEWRHFNALYFPYVAGLRPYSRGARHAALTETETKALRWFQAQIPERTLYNWQTAAAALVARHLREV